MMKEMANAVRFLSMDAIVRANDGHYGVHEHAMGAMMNGMTVHPRNRS